MTRFAWDFFGPLARDVAARFLVQLQARVPEAHVGRVVCGSWMHAPDHAVVWLDAASPAAIGWVRQALAPSRELSAQRRV